MPLPSAPASLESQRLEPAGPLGGAWLLAETSPDAVFVPEDLDAESVALARAVRQFVEREILPRTPAIESREPGLTPRLLREAGRLGLMGLEVPEEYGGLGLDLRTACLLAEELARQGSFAVSHGAHSVIGTLPLVWFGTAAQKERYLPRLASGEWVGAFALSEAGFGSDALGAATRARLNEAGTHYVLNGTKMWTSNAGFADLITLFAQVEAAEGARPGRTFTAFLVERTTPGVSIGREEHKLGIQGSSTCRVILEDALVPVENVLHQVGRGHVVALNVLNAGRLKLGAGNLGPAKDLLRISARYANERVQGGRPIAQYGLIQEKLAEQAVRIFAAESAVYRAAGLVAAWQERAVAGDANLAPSEHPDLPVRAQALEEYLVECALLKVLGSEALDYVVDEALQIHGGYGYTEEFPIARAYRDARINRIFEGTNEINRLTITGTLLRRAARGRLPLLGAVERARTELLEPLGIAEVDDTPLAAEAAVLADARKLILVTSGLAAQKWGERLMEEQEIAGAIADQILAFYAAESALLRARKLIAAQGDRGVAAGELAQVAVAVAAGRIEAEARRILAAVSVGDELRTQLALLRRFSRRLPADTISLRRSIARRVIAQERYPLTRT